jgi:hypothetical protein
MPNVFTPSRRGASLANALNVQATSFVLADEMIE